MRSVAIRLKERGVVFDLSAIASEIDNFVKKKNSEMSFVGSSADFLALSALLFEGNVKEAFDKAAKILWEGDLLAEVEQEEVVNDLNNLFEKLGINARAEKGSMKVSGEDAEKFLRELREYLIDKMNCVLNNYVKQAQDALAPASCLSFGSQGGRY